MIILLYLSLLLFVSAVPTKPVSRYYPWNPVTWTIAPRSIPSDTEITLSWKGGSGLGFEVYFIPSYNDQRLEDYAPVNIASTSASKVRWVTPGFTAYPNGTSFILAVNDLTEGQGSVWYDLTGRLPFIEKKGTK